jgi:hypothetical protein
MLGTDEGVNRLLSRREGLQRDAPAGHEVVGSP